MVRMWLPGGALGMTTSAFEIRRGASPVILAFPHTGTDVPAAILEWLNDNGRRLADTDWHIHRLYDGLLADATTVRASFHRYVIDANRDPAGTSLYPGQNTTGLVPLLRFSGEPVYLDGRQPDAAEVAMRIERYWRPYHAALRGELDRLRALHGRAVLWEGHSIRGSGLPFLFEGRLPDLNLGTAGGASCTPALQARLEATLAAQDDYDWVANGRFQGGHITRHYGDPGNGIDAVQLETSQRSYMDEASFAYDEARATRLQP